MGLSREKGHANLGKGLDLEIKLANRRCDKICILSQFSIGIYSIVPFFNYGFMIRSQASLLPDLFIVAVDR